MIVKEYDCQRIDWQIIVRMVLLGLQGEQVSMDWKEVREKNVRSLVYYQTPLGSSPPGLDFFTKKIYHYFCS